MTRTAVRRRVDVSDGRLVVRKVVIETSECLDAGPANEPLADAAPQPVEVPQATKRRGLRPGKYSVRIRQFHLL
jgi:hypothetical protein